MKPLNTRLIALLLLTSLLTACQTLEERRMQKGLESTLNAYAATVRWGHLAQIYSYLDTTVEQQPQDQEILGNIRVTNYNVLQNPVMTSEELAQQSVAIQYVFIDRQVEKTLIDNQIWQFSEETERWTRINTIPDFK